MRTNSQDCEATSPLPGPQHQRQMPGGYPTGAASPGQTGTGAGAPGEVRSSALLACGVFIFASVEVG